MSTFVRPPKSEELGKFKKSLSSWSKNKAGALEDKLGERIQIETANGCEVFVVSIESLIEERTTEVKSTPAKKKSLNTTPTVAHGSANVWSRPTPSSLKSQFETATFSEEIPGTEFYVACKTCNELGHTDCGTCNKTGKLVCGQCNGSKKHDCHDCNGFGFFDCTACNKGMVDNFCSACDSGKIPCDGCGGKGSHYSLMTGKGSDCYQCNGSGKRTCLVCGGSDREVGRCSKCNNGNIPCQTCRTQKTVTCSSCDPNGRVNCSKCSGKSVLACTPCKTEGGFRHVEHLVYKSTIETNDMTLSAVEKIRDKIRLSFQDVTEMTQPRLTLDEIKAKSPQAELLGPIEQIYTHIDQNRPTSTLLERFKLSQATVLDVSFKYEDQAGHAYFDCNSGLLYVDVNPLEQKASGARETLKSSYKAAKAKEKIGEARKLIDRAKQLNLSDLSKSWSSEIDALEKQIHTREATAYRNTVMLPVLYGFGPAVWFIAGFITPMSLTALILFSFFGIAEAQSSSKKLDQGKRSQQKIFKSQLIRLGVIFLTAILLGLALQYYNTQNSIEGVFKDGAPLAGDSQ